MDIVLEPHHDDAILFAAFQICRCQPLVVTVLGDATVQEQYGVNRFVREAETGLALEEVGASAWISWEHSDYTPDWEDVWDDMRRLNEAHHPETVYAPLSENGGHPHHNKVGQLAHDHFDNVRYYTSYTTGGVRSRIGDLVDVEPEWVFQKLAALSHYRSQAKTPSFKHFTEDLREYIA
jgi:hypothetical protein